MTIRECLPRLTAIGIEYNDAVALRRIAMTLHRWHELECGSEHGAIQRDEKTGQCFWYNSSARYLSPNDPRAYTPVADRETGARKRLAKIMAKYPTLRPYVQGDPCGAPLFILRPGDVPEGADADCYYSRGIAVYQ